MRVKGSIERNVVSTAVMRAYVWDYKYIIIIRDLAISSKSCNGDVRIDCEKSIEC